MSLTNPLIITALASTGWPSAFGLMGDNQHRTGGSMKPNMHRASERAFAKKVTRNRRAKKNGKRK